MNDKTYEEILDLYNYSYAQEKYLYRDLKKLTEEIFLGKNNLLENQRKEELRNGNPYKSRFFRDNMDSHKFVVGKKVPEMYICKPEIKFPGKEEFLSYSENEKKTLEANIYKKISIILARRINLSNRNKNTDPNAYNMKDMHIKEFLSYASIYNSMVREEEMILYGFTEDQSKGAFLLDASLPGYTRLSVHFGNDFNFYRTLTNVNRFLNQKGFSKEFPTYTTKERKRKN